MAKKAKRQKLRGAIAIIGPSGSGKTLGALVLAYGMMKSKYPDAPDEEVWDKIGLIDTEHERSLVYEGMMYGGTRIGEFWHEDMKPPYSVERFQNFASNMVHENRVEVIINDSLSHAWMGEGGVLDYHEMQGGKFQSWNTTNKDSYFPLVSYATGETTKVHMINTMRTKQEYVMQANEIGKMEVVKMGLQPVQRDQFEYEFQIVFNVDMDHKTRASKDNSGLFADMNTIITPEHGQLLYDWLEAGKDIFAEREAEAKKLEDERIAFAETIRQVEKDHNLSVFVKSMEQHQAINCSVENMDMETLKKLYVAMDKKIQALEENKTKTQTEKGAN